MNKVKYNRKEYREEYLKSDEWKSLRDLILIPEIPCQVCKTMKATDAHHMIYRNLVDIKVTDLLPVCRSCHDYIHMAIADGYIPTEDAKIELITKLTKNILNDERYKDFHVWLGSKHNLSNAVIHKIIGNTNLVNRVSGLLKRKIWFDDIAELKVTGRQILKIDKIIRIEKYRRRFKSSKKNRKQLGYGENKYGWMKYNL